MKKSLIVISALFLVSCTKKPTVELDNPIEFTGRISNIQATTNTGTVSTSWLTNDEIGIFMVNNVNNNVIEDNSNRKYIYSGAKFNPSADADIYYPMSDSKVGFIAYYPYKSGTSLGALVPINIADQSNQVSLDFLYAKSNNNGLGYNKTTGANVSLLFDHKMSKVVIKLSAGDGLANTSANWRNMKVTLNGFNTMCNFDLVTGIISSASTPLSIIPYTRTVATVYEAIVIPGTYQNPGAINFNFEIAGENYVWRSSANEEFESGKEYTYNITVNKTGIAMGNVTINDWITAYRSGTAL